MKLKDLLLTLGDNCDIGLYDSGAEYLKLITDSVSATPAEILKYEDCEVVCWRPAIFDEIKHDILGHEHISKFIRLIIGLKIK